MARFTKTLDIWELSETERARLQPGQWVSTGQDGPRGRYWGQTRAGGDVVGWTGNVAGRGFDYHRTLRQYARSLAA